MSLDAPGGGYRPARVPGGVIPQKDRGRAGIRTRERVAPLAVFKTAAFATRANDSERRFCLRFRVADILGSLRFPSVSPGSPPIVAPVWPTGADLGIAPAARTGSPRRRSWVGSDSARRLSLPMGSDIRSGSRECRSGSRATPPREGRRLAAFELGGREARSTVEAGEVAAVRGLAHARIDDDIGAPDSGNRRHLSRRPRWSPSSSRPTPPRRRALRATSQRRRTL